MPVILLIYLLGSVATLVTSSSYIPPSPPTPAELHLQKLNNQLQGISREAFFLRECQEEDYQLLKADPEFTEFTIDPSWTPQVFHAKLVRYTQKQLAYTVLAGVQQVLFLERQRQLYYTYAEILQQEKEIPVDKNQAILNQEEYFIPPTIQIVRLGVDVVSSSLGVVTLNNEGDKELFNNLNQYVEGTEKQLEFEKQVAENFEKASKNIFLSPDLRKMAGDAAKASRKIARSIEKALSDLRTQLIKRSGGVVADETYKKLLNKLITRGPKKMGTILLVVSTLSSMVFGSTPSSDVDGQIEQFRQLEGQAGQALKSFLDEGIAQNDDGVFHDMDDPAWEATLSNMQTILSQLKDTKSFPPQESLKSLKESLPFQNLIQKAIGQTINCLVDHNPPETCSFE